MKVVVTGGAGFIGANLCRMLDEDFVDHVVALDDLSTGRARTWPAPHRSSSVKAPS